MESYHKTSVKRTYFNLSILLLAAIIVVMPIIFFGIPNGSDTPQHYQFALTFFNSIQNGNFYPGWADATNGGYGDVGIRFYPPLAYYVMVGFRYLAGNWYDASILTFTFWFFLSGVGLYYWCREWFGENASLAAAVVYIFMPYHANQIYNASTYAEFAASSILPFCFLFVTRVCRSGKITDLIGLAVFYALLVLTHIPLTIIGSIGLLIYSVLSLKKSKIFFSLVKLASSVVLGLLASSFYWARMVGELDWVKHTTDKFTANEYDFHSNFLCSFLYSIFSEEHFRSSWFCDSMLLISAGVFVPCAFIFYGWSKEKTNGKLFGVSILFAFSVFIATPLSVVIWENFSILEKIQFPWRWLAITSMTAAFFVAAGYNNLLNLFYTKTRPLALLTVGLIAICIVFTFTKIIRQSNQMPREDFNAQTKYLINSKSYECWWTAWSKKEGAYTAQKVTVENRSAEIIGWRQAEREITFSAGNPTVARIATFYYPHWRATVNGQPNELQVDDNGVMLVPLPSETTNVRIWFQEPESTRIFSYISLFFWLVFLSAGLFVFWKNKTYRFSEFGQNESDFFNEKT